MGYCARTLRRTPPPQDAKVSKRSFDVSLQTSMKKMVDKLEW
jgi:hypothetical protein